MRYTLMQISDLHAGPPFRQDIAEVVARQAHEVRPDLLIISGDFVQRAALPWQWNTITTYLETLPTPRLVVPGNHDVPLFDPLSRMFAPMRYYTRHISSDLTPTFDLPGLLVVGGNSAHGWTTDGGYVGRRQQQALGERFASASADTCRVMVLHHPVVQAPGNRHKSRISNAAAIWKLMQQWGVDLFLCGHVHFSFVDLCAGPDGAPPAAALERQGIVIGQSGTTTSRRGRGVDRDKNSFNLIEIDEQHIRIQPHFYVPDAQRFEPIAERVFARRQVQANE
jgi:3',5'-cyclic AMP phosphodiesterase CpdA